MTDPLAALRNLPRLRLAHLPTPLERMPRLGAALGIESLWVKRDDCTGLGFGGNKVRKLEFDLAAAIQAKADSVVCGGNIQSNTARQVAAACAKLGLECHLGIMRGRVAQAADTGNFLLDRLFGAIIHDIPWDEDRNRHLRDIVAALEAAGRKPYLVPYGASDALGALGYALAAEEIVQALPDAGWIVHASGSAGTQAGLVAGLIALDHPAQVIGIDVDAQPERVTADVRRVGREAAALLKAEDKWDDARVTVAREWSAGAYGAADAGTLEAIRMAARLEGLALDPVYTGKAMAGLIGLARAGHFKDAPVVWLHTGGSPGIFAYPELMIQASRGVVETRPKTIRGYAMKLFAAAAILAALTAPAFAADVTVDVPMAFPESLTSTPNGTIYVGSMNLGAVYRALPGERTTKTWISKEAGNFGRVLGVLADKGTLYVCDNNGDHAYLKTFSLKTAALLKTNELPGGGFCNDIALKGADAYITDTKGGRVLKLAAGSDALTVWYTNDKSDSSLDGLVWQGDALYTNTYNGNHLIRIPMNADGSAGKGVNLATSMDIVQPDGMRLSSSGKILLVEGRGKDGNGRLDEVTVSGDSATITVIKDKYMLPTAVTVVGGTAYVLEAKLNYQRDPALKDKDPGAFKAYAVPLK